MLQKMLQNVIILNFQINFYDIKKKVKSDIFLWAKFPLLH